MLDLLLCIPTCRQTWSQSWKTNWSVMLWCPWQTNWNVMLWCPQDSELHFFFSICLKEKWNHLEDSLLKMCLWALFYCNPSEVWSFLTFCPLRLLPDLFGTSKQYHCSPGSNSNPPLQGGRKSISKCQMAKKWCSSGSGATTDHHQKNRLWFTSENPGSGYYGHRILPVCGFEWNEDNNCNGSVVCKAWWVLGFFDYSDCF